MTGSRSAIVATVVITTVRGATARAGVGEPSPFLDEQTDSGIGLARRPGVAWHVADSGATLAEDRLLTSRHLNVGASFRFGR